MPEETLPTFFFSYAHKDEKPPSPKLTQFFEDLQDTLEQRTPATPAGVRLGTYDRRNTHGGDWDDELSKALKTSKALVAVATQPYFGSVSCGKEIAVFARRHDSARLDSDGALRHATNILHIRWLDDAAYQSNGVKDAALHPVLRKVSWTPAQNGRPDRSKAIGRYRDKGMELCVKPSRDYYVELLRAFADSLKNMPALPTASFPVAWNSIRSAFESDWADLPREQADPAPLQAVVAAAPAGPADAVVFYITRRTLVLDLRSPSFADRLVDEHSWRHSTAQAPSEPFFTVLEVMQQAMMLEHLNGFHCACEPQIPVSAGGLIDRLAALTARNVLVALVVDPTLWLAANAADDTRSVLDEVVKSERWGGPVILPVLSDDDRAIDLAVRLAEKAVPRSVTVVSGNTDRTIAGLRSTLLRERGRILQAGTATTPTDDAPLPLLHGPGSAQK